MKASIHPNYQPITVTCSCGHVLETRSTLADNLSIEICSNCHPFYTGHQKDLGKNKGQIKRFYDRYAKRTSDEEK